MKNYIIELEPGLYVSYFKGIGNIETTAEPRSAWVDLEENLIDLAEEHNITLFVLKEVDPNHQNYII